MTKRTFEDAFNLLCGEKLGSGIHRVVYECRLRDDLVVKVEISEHWRNFSNVKEHQFWSDQREYEPVRKWLAPCEYLSPDGRISLQRRVRPAAEGDTLPERLPGFITDVKRENFGWLDGNLVLVDYAWTIPNPSIRLRKADWL